MHSIIPITALILSVLRTLLLYKDGFELQILNMQILKQREFLITGRDPFNQTFRKFRSKTQWIGSVQPEKFRKNGSTF